MTSRLREIAQDVIEGRAILSEAALAEERLKVCHDCPAYRKLLQQCAVCGCIVSLKVKLLRSTCPVEKW